MVKEVVSLIDWKSGLPAGMPPQSNDSSWEEERQLLPARWLLILSNLQFSHISSTAGPAREETLAQCPKGSARFVWLVQEREESPSEDGSVLAVQTRGCALARVSRGSARFLLPDQPALSFLCSWDRDFQRIKAANTQCHCFIRKCLEIIQLLLMSSFSDSLRVWGPWTG